MTNVSISQLNNLSFNNQEALFSQGAGSVINSVFGMFNSDYTEEQKADAAGNFVEGVINLISGFLCANNDGQQKVSENRNEINQAGNEAQQITNTLDNNLNNVNNICKSNIEKINVALAQIEELGGDSGALQQLKENISKKLDEIEEAQEIYNNPETSKEERENALNVILGASGEINALTSEINTLSVLITEQQMVIDSCSEEVNTAVTDLNTNIQNAEQQLAQNTAEVQQNTAETASIATDGATDTGMGTTQVATGEAMAATVYGAEAGAELISTGEQNISNGTVETTGAATNTAQQVAKVTQTFQQVIQNQQGIGIVNGLIDTINNCIGKSAEQIPSMIKSIGSISAQNEILQSAVEDISDAEDNEKTDDKNDTTNLNNNKNNIFNYDANQFKNVLGI